LPVLPKEKKLHALGGNEGAHAGEKKGELGAAFRIRRTKADDPSFSEGIKEEKTQAARFQCDQEISEAAPEERAPISMCRRSESGQQLQSGKKKGARRAVVLSSVPSEKKFRRVHERSMDAAMIERQCAWEKKGWSGNCAVPVS